MSNGIYDVNMYFVSERSFSMISRFPVGIFGHAWFVTNGTVHDTVIIIKKLRVLARLQCQSFVLMSNGVYSLSTSSKSFCSSLFIP